MHVKLLGTVPCSVFKNIFFLSIFPHWHILDSLKDWFKIYLTKYSGIGSNGALNYKSIRPRTHERLPSLYNFAKRTMIELSQIYITQK